MVVLPSFSEDASHTEGLYYVDAQLKAHLVYKSYLNAYGVLSPDEKHMALLGADVTSNVWSFQRASRH